MSENKYEQRLNHVYERMVRLFSSEPVSVIKTEDTIILSPTKYPGDVSFQPQYFLKVIAKGFIPKVGAIIQIQTAMGYITYYFKDKYFDSSFAPITIGQLVDLKIEEKEKGDSDDMLEV